MVKCKICNNDYKRITKSHLMKHDIENEKEYLIKFPNAEIMDTEYKKNISIGTKLGMNNDEVRNKLKYIRTPEMNKNNSKMVASLHKKGVYDNIYTVERNKKISNAKTEYWKNNDTSILAEWLNEYRGSEKHIELCRSNNLLLQTTSISKPEKEYAKKLKKEGIEFIQQYNVNNFLFDFYIPSKNLLVEIDGEFWHPLTEDDCVYDFQFSNFKRDIRKNKVAKMNGFNLERIRV